MVVHYNGTLSVLRSYKQNKYNLFREESEGYAKLTTELSQEITSKISPDYMIEVMRSLIGEACSALFPFIYSHIFALSRSRALERGAFSTCVASETVAKEAGRWFELFGVPGSMESKAWHVGRKRFKARRHTAKRRLAINGNRLRSRAMIFSWNVTHCHERDLSTPACSTADQEASLWPCDFRDEGFRSLLRETLCWSQGHRSVWIPTE